MEKPPLSFKHPGLPAFPLRCTCSLASEPASLSGHWKGAVTPATSPYYCFCPAAEGRAPPWSYFHHHPSLAPIICLEALRRKQTSTIPSRRSKHTTLTGAAIFTKPAPSRTVLPASWRCVYRREAAAACKPKPIGIRALSLPPRTGCTRGGAGSSQWNRRTG